MSGDRFDGVPPQVRQQYKIPPRQSALTVAALVGAAILGMAGIIKVTNAISAKKAAPSGQKCNSYLTKGPGGG